MKETRTEPYQGREAKSFVTTTMTGGRHGLLYHTGEHTCSLVSGRFTNGSDFGPDAEKVSTQNISTNNVR